MTFFPNLKFPVRDFMKNFFLELIIIATIYGCDSLPDNYYCDLCNGSHTLCKYHSGPSEKCNGYKIIPMTSDFQAYITFLHNVLRNEIALNSSATFSSSSSAPSMSSASSMSESSKFKSPKFESPKFESPKFESPKFESPKFESSKFKSKSTKLVSSKSKSSKFLKYGKLPTGRNSSSYNLIQTVSNMKELIWSSELARIAERWADQCDPTDAQDQCRDTPKFPVGQNVYSLTDPSEDLNVKEVIFKWYQEGKYHLILKAEVEYFGCASVSFEVNSTVVEPTVPPGDTPLNTSVPLKLLNKKLVCNYGPANFSPKLFEVGTPCSSCPTKRCGETFKGLCEKSQSPTPHLEALIQSDEGDSRGTGEEPWGFIKILQQLEEDIKNNSSVIEKLTKINSSYVFTTAVDPEEGFGPGDDEEFYLTSTVGNIGTTRYKSGSSRSFRMSLYFLSFNIVKFYCLCFFFLENAEENFFSGECGENCNLMQY